MKTHYLKILPPYFKEVKAGTKTFEHRLNDRDYQVGDYVELQEYDAFTTTYSGSKLICQITYILKEVYGLDKEFCIFSFRRLGFDFNPNINNENRT